MTGESLTRSNRPNADSYEHYQGVLSAPLKARPRPFEIILATPQAAPQYQQERALVAAMQTILAEYQKLMAYAPNL